MYYLLAIVVNFEYFNTVWHSVRTSISEKEQITMWVLTNQILHTRKGTDLISTIKKKDYYPFQHVYNIVSIMISIFIKI